MAREGIDGSTIQYEDNQALLDMILSKQPMGLLAICDEEALFPKVILSLTSLTFIRSLASIDHPGNWQVHVREAECQLGQVPQVREAPW